MYRAKLCEYWVFDLLRDMRIKLADLLVELQPEIYLIRPAIILKRLMLSWAMSVKVNL